MPRRTSTERPLPMDLLSVAQREEHRTTLREKLRSDQAAMEERQQLLPEKNPVRLRVEDSEASVLCQHRARNPDSILARGLLSARQRYVLFFRQNADYLLDCQIVGRSAEQAPRTPDVRNLGPNVMHLQDYQAAYRISEALILAGSIFLERGAVVAGLRMQLAAYELRTILQPENAHEELSKHFSRINQNVHDTADIATQLITRNFCGYRVFPEGEDPSVIFAAHEEGALLVLRSGKEPLEVDVSLVTDDPMAFPEPDLRAALLPHEFGYPSLRYTDRKGRQRELAYNAVANAYRFV